MFGDIIYLDNNASTPIDPRVLSIFIQSCTEIYANPSNNSHILGRMAQESIYRAREQIKTLLHAEDFQVIFTSGATESLNLAILGLNPSKVLVGATEHKAVFNTCRWLARQNKSDFEVFPVDGDGIAYLDEVEKGLRKPTDLLAAMLANNETGVIHPIPEIASLASKEGVPLLCDATQAIGKIPINLNDIGADLVAISGHKIYGPKGVGALLFRQHKLSKNLKPLLFGGGQEFGLRSGTENVPAIIAFAKAIEISVQEQQNDACLMKELRDNFESLLHQRAAVVFNGQKACRLPNTSNISCLRVAVEDVLRLITRIAISTGAACTTQEVGGSRILRAMGVDNELATNSLRISFGRFNTREESYEAAEVLAKAINSTIT